MLQVKTAQFAQPAIPRAARCGRTPHHIPRASLSDVGAYLADGVRQIIEPFSSTTVPWPSSPFDGRITHHDEAARMRNQEPEFSTVHVEAASVTATNSQEASRTVITKMDRLFRLKNGQEPPTFKNSSIAAGGYRARGRTNREMRHEINRLRR